MPGRKGKTLFALRLCAFALKKTFQRALVDEKFEYVVKSAQDAAVLVLVY
jgi:hypothetical protein